MLERDEFYNLRQAMGTLPFDPKDIPDKQKYKISKGVSELRVDLIEYTKNPYKAMFEFATETWGNSKGIDKWPQVSPEHRFLVVNSVLRKETLPLALEVPHFQFRIIGAARSSF